MNIILPYLFAFVLCAFAFQHVSDVPAFEDGSPLEAFVAGVLWMSSLTDGDGLSDGDEIIAGTDPLDPNDPVLPAVPTLPPLGIAVLAGLLMGLASRRVAREGRQVG